MNSENKNPEQIIIIDEKHSLPYSKGLMASSLTATGLPPARAYRVAAAVQKHLRDNEQFSIKMDELREIVYNTLLAHEGKSYADKYQRWQKLLTVDRPIIVLIGGTTGVGKSTIATTVAHRLGITHIVPTDALREVMRAVLSRELIPALHESSFMAWKTVNQAFEQDPLIAGFIEQAKTVSVGIRAVIERSIKEGLNVVIEGVHIVPGFIGTPICDPICDKAFLIPMIITVDDEDLHRSHFYIRELQTEGVRPYERYRTNFELIRKIGDYICDLAKDRKIPIISSSNLDTTVSAAMEEVLYQVLGPPSEDFSDQPEVAENRLAE